MSIGTGDDARDEGDEFSKDEGNKESSCSTLSRSWFESVGDSGDRSRNGDGERET